MIHSNTTTILIFNNSNYPNLSLKQYFYPVNPCNSEAFHYTNRCVEDWVHSHQDQVFFFLSKIKTYWTKHTGVVLTILNSKETLHVSGFSVAGIGSWLSLTSAKGNFLAGYEETHLFSERPGDPVNWQKRRQVQQPELQPKSCCRTRWGGHSWHPCCSRPFPGRRLGHGFCCWCWEMPLGWISNCLASFCHLFTIHSGRQDHQIWPCLGHPPYVSVAGRGSLWPTEVFRETWSLAFYQVRRGFRCWTVKEMAHVY